MDKCDCTISHRVNGDGCRYCQPQEYIERLSDWINEAREEITALAKERKDLEHRLSEAEAKIPKWIPVEERLPKPGANILAIDNSGDMGVCNFVNARFVGECFGFEAYLNDGGWDCSASKVIGEYVTHWMTPEPPVNESGGE